ncbi:MAG: TIGR03790 family protein [Armatimonadota bacterium]|nr:TIGR03790 family protein [Armatimonadota bacterium]
MIAKWLRFMSIILIFSMPFSLCHAAKPTNVLVVINDNSPDSKEIGAYYVRKRGIPTKNVCHIKCPAAEEIEDKDYRPLIEKPVKAYLAKTGLNKTVDYIVLTKGIPIKLRKSGMSVDSMLMCMDLGFSFENLKQGIPNPYFKKREHFSHKKYGFYLATRLDGHTKKDAKALVDRALAAKAARGVFIFDICPAKNSESYRIYNGDARQANDLLSRKGYISYLDDTSEFIGGRKRVMGYFSWGSNDPSYDFKKYCSNQFLPGAIAETAVSTSARSFSHYKAGQSMIADLIAAGVTGVKGYVSEPYLSAVAMPSILFERYVSGFNLAESFYMASRFIFWKDIVVGDPLTAPYAGAGAN